MHSPVVFESYDSLKEKGLVIDGNYIEGVMIGVEKTEIRGNLFWKKAIVDCYQWVSLTGAVGIRCELKFKNGFWQVEKTEMTWIS